MAVFTDKQMIGMGVAVAVLGYLAWKKGLPAIGNAVNPVNPDNVFYSGTNAVGEALTGEEGFSLGAWLYDVTHTSTDTINGG